MATWWALLELALRERGDSGVLACAPDAAAFDVPVFTQQPPALLAWTECRMYFPVAAGARWIDSAPRDPVDVAQEPVGSLPETAPGIAARLLGTETLEQGQALLDQLRPDGETLRAAATELGISRLEPRISLRELRRRVLQQAIGSRRKFDGLRKW